MRRISCSDQRTSLRCSDSGRGRVCSGGGVGAMAGHREDGEGQHHQRDVTMPAVPGTGLVVVEAQFGLGRLEAVLDGPALALDRGPGSPSACRPGTTS